MRKEILKMLERNSKYTAAEIAAAINSTEDAVASEIKAMEDEHIICGYSAAINWDNTEEEYVTALIEVKVTPQRGDGFDKIAERIYRLDEVSAVYLMSGGFDLTIIIQGRTIKEIAFFVSDKLSPINAVISTATHFVLKKYKDHGIILEKDQPDDERMKIVP